MSRFARLTDGLLRRMEKHAAAVVLPIAFLLFLAASLSFSLAGQEGGPAPGPPSLNSPTVKPSVDAPPPPKTPAADRQSSGITKDPPLIPADQIIRQFAAREAELKTERE